MRGCMAAQVKVGERGLGLLRPMLNASPVCDKSDAEGSLCVNAALHKLTLHLPLPFYIRKYVYC